MNGWVLMALCAVYLLAGIVGHDPWKSDDAIHLGIAYEFARSGDWLDPRIGVESIPGTAPLYHWTAALLGKGLQFVLPFHDAARLASALFGALLLFAAFTTARLLTRRAEAGPLAPLLVIGTLGLVLPLHDAQPAVAMLAAQACAYAAVALLRSKPWPAAAVVALSVAGAFWSGGVTGLLPTLPPILFALMHREWRGGWLAALLGIAVGIALGAAWPLLSISQTDLSFAAWWHDAMLHLNSFDDEPYALRDHFELLSWFVWPTLPIALWSLWVKRSSLNDPIVALPLTGCVLSFIAFFLTSSPKPLGSLHLVVPLALLALPGAERLRRGASNAFDWFGIMTFTLMTGLVWLGGIAIATGSPARIAKNFYKPEPGFVGHVSIPLFVIAALLTLGWLWVLLAPRRTPWRSAMRWAAGVTLTWSLIATLWLPWIDYAKTYRPVALSLKSRIAGRVGDDCIASKNVGLAQKASFRYFANIVTYPVAARDDCSWLLIQGVSDKEPELKGMKKIWEGNRGGDKSERLRLYRRG